MLLSALLLACAPKEPDPLEAALMNENIEATVALDQQELLVRWDDGDTFTYKDAQGEKHTARLSGFNALESYGPVHKWGEWTGEELHALAKRSGAVARSQIWYCTRVEGGSGGYGRDLVSCPELGAALVGQGLAFVFAVEEEPDPALLKLQQKAIKKKRGMWAKGVPQGLITSLHSADEYEAGSGEQPYNRVCDPRTGRCPGVVHAETYGVCQEVCVQGSCMLYVPYKQRYGADKAECLR